MNRLLVVLTLCFSAAATVAVAQQTGQPHKLTEQDKEFINKATAAAGGRPGDPLEFPQFDIDVSDFAPPEQLDQAQREAQALADQIMSEREGKMMLDKDFQYLPQDGEPGANAAPTPKPYTEHTTLVFASLGLGEQGLNDVLAMASGMDDVAVVFRGIPEGESMSVAMTRLQQLAAQHDPMPSVIIDPSLFLSYKVTAVPTIVVVDKGDLPLAGDPATPIAKVAGISDPDWLHKAIARGESGDLGNKGPVEEISEVDLLEAAKARVAQIDWEEKQKKALTNFWYNQKFIDLPRAPKQRTRIFDPSIVIMQDIKAPDGTYIARQGDIINPLEIRDFTQAVIVFDPTDQQQVELVIKKAAKLESHPAIGFVSYIATKIDRIEGWKSYEKITDQLDAHVTLLTPDVAQRFELEYVPSVITSGGKVFHITELAKN